MFLCESAFEGLAFLRVLAEMAKGVFDTITNRRIECLKVLDSLGRKANLSHCSSLKTCLNDLSFPALASFNTCRSDLRAFGFDNTSSVSTHPSNSSAPMTTAVGVPFFVTT